jgi:hypothetical protein
MGGLLPWTCRPIVGGCVIGKIIRTDQCVTYAPGMDLWISGKQAGYVRCAGGGGSQEKAQAKSIETGFGYLPTIRLFFQ